MTDSVDRSLRDTADPALERLATAAAETGVRWAVLRGAIERPDGGDLDLLVHPDDLLAFAAAARRSGFPRLPAWGHGHHRFHVGRGRGGWWRLDVVDRLRFAGRVELPLSVVDELLDRRTTTGVPRLHPDDAAWALVLHLLLDRDQRSPRDHERLAAAADAGTSGPVAAAIDAAVGPDLDAASVGAALRDETSTLADLRRRIRRRWPALADRSLAGRGRRLRVALAGRLRKPLTAIYRSGPSVALMGPDGAGKSALVDGLCEAFPLPVRTAYLGLYPVDGRRAGGPKGLGLATRLGRLWRGYLGARAQRWRGRLVVFDRHPLDARLPARGRRRPTDRLRRWLLGHALPIPDLVLILDAPGSVLHARKAEFDAGTLEQERARYRELGARLSRAQLVDASRPADVVLDDVVDRIWRVWAERLDRGPRS